MKRRIQYENSIENIKNLYSFLDIQIELNIICEYRNISTFLRLFVIFVCTNTSLSMILIVLDTSVPFTKPYGSSNSICILFVRIFFLYFLISLYANFSFCTYVTFVHLTSHKYTTFTYISLHNHILTYTKERLKM